MVYLRDLKEELQTEAFLGKGLNKLKEKAKKGNKEIVVGAYFDKPKLEGL